MTDQATTTPGPDLPDRAFGRRIGGALIDVVACAALLIPSAVLFGQATAQDGRYEVNVQGLGGLGYLGVCLLYFTVFELLFGATIGKLLVGVRVRNEKGGRAAPWQIIVRNLLRPIDVLPLLYLVGYLVAMSSGPAWRQRLGDRAARTVVVPREAPAA